MSSSLWPQQQAYLLWDQCTVLSGSFHIRPGSHPIRPGKTGHTPTPEKLSVSGERRCCLNSQYPGFRPREWKWERSLYKANLGYSYHNRWNRFQPERYYKYPIHVISDISIYPDSSMFIRVYWYVCVYVCVCAHRRAYNPGLKKTSYIRQIFCWWC